MALIASLRQSHVLAAAMILAHATAIEASGATLQEKATNVHHVLPRGENALPPRARRRLGAVVVRLVQTAPGARCADAMEPQ